MRPDVGGETFLQKLWFSQDPHGVTAKKTAFFIVTAVKASNRIDWRVTRPEQDRSHAIIQAISCRLSAAAVWLLPQIIWNS
jgi:hypothetical protein